jgi:hypothetical protein
MPRTNKEDAIIKFFLSLLVLSAFTSSFKIEIIFFSLNLSQVIAAALFILLVIYNAVNKKSPLVLYRDKLSILIYSYFLINIFSSVLFAAKKGQSLRGCAVILSYLLIYVTVRWAMKFIFDKRLFIRKLQAYNNLSASFGLISMCVSIAIGKEIIGVTFGHLAQSGIENLQSPIPSIQSLSLEPNLFAIITAVILSLNLSTYLLQKKSTKQLGAIVWLSVSILFSYTRSVYISIAVSLFFILILSKRLKLMISIFNYVVVILIIIMAVFLILPEGSDVKVALSDRATSLFDFQKGSGLGRTLGYQIGFDGFLHNPIFGNGTLSANTTFYNVYRKQEQEYMGSPGWLNGALIQSLQDTGLIGFFIVLGLFTSIIIANYRLFTKLDNSDEKKSVVLGFIGGNVILLISSQLSSPLWISFPYIYWAINMAYINFCESLMAEQKAIGS